MQNLTCFEVNKLLYIFIEYTQRVRGMPERDAQVVQMHKTDPIGHLTRIHNNILFAM